MDGLSFDALVELIAKLRDPADGCPWDRAQDHASLRTYMLEEAYEAIAAIDAGDPVLLKDELGDVLLQVLLHSQIASERDAFRIDDVIENLGAKLVRRHPHVFADASNDLPSIHRRWEEIKDGEGMPKPTPPVLIAARKAVSSLDALEKRSEELEGEAKAGLGILRGIAAAWEAGYDPELALRKAMDELHAAELGRAQ